MTICPSCGELANIDAERQLCWLCLIDAQNANDRDFLKGMAALEFDDCVGNEYNGDELAD